MIVHNFEIIAILFFCLFTPTYFAIMVDCKLVR